MISEDSPVRSRSCRFICTSRGGGGRICLPTTIAGSDDCFLHYLQPSGLGSSRQLRKELCPMTHVPLQNEVSFFYFSSEISFFIFSSFYVTEDTAARHVFGHKWVGRRGRA